MLLSRASPLAAFGRRALASLDAASTQRRSTKPRKSGHARQHFVDQVQVQLSGGRGGDGCIAFTQLFCNPTAGPGGGDGGPGGHVLLEATGQRVDLAGVSRHAAAKAGVRGQGANRHGAGAAHLRLLVPLGTQVRCQDSGRLLADLTVEGEVWVAARGGAGGKGNAFFLSAGNRAPRVAERGADGEVARLSLELKLTAAAGLVGFPNAGKSTLLRAVSRARPKVAAYPFTTLRPLLGVVQFEDGARLAVADLPGLVVGAARHGTGLGAEFLRHVERCRCLLLVVDAAADAEQLHPVDQVLALRAELEEFQPGLGAVPQLLLANKLDLAAAAPRLPDLAALAARLDLDFLAVSGRAGHHVPEMLAAVRRQYDVSLRREQERLATAAAAAAIRDEADDRALFDEQRRSALAVIDRL